MERRTSDPSSDKPNTSQVSLPLFLRVLAHVWRLVSRMNFLLFGLSSSSHWIERVTLRAFSFSSKFFGERKCQLNMKQRVGFVTVTSELKTVLKSSYFHSAGH